MLTFEETPQHEMCCAFFFNFCIELLFIVFDNVEIAFRIFVFDHSWHSASSRLIGHNNLLFIFSFIRLRSILIRSTPSHCDAAHYTLIVTRIVNSACVKRLIEFKTSSKVSVTIAGDCNSIGALDVMVATWNVLCVFIFCIELLFIVFDNVEIAFRIFVFDHSWHSIESTNWTQQFVVYFFIHSSSINSHLINTISL